MLRAVRAFLKNNYLIMVSGCSRDVISQAMYLLLSHSTHTPPLATDGAKLLLKNEENISNSDLMIFFDVHRNFCSGHSHVNIWHGTYKYCLLCVRMSACAFVSVPG